jgi:hypothetical protein
MTIAKRAPFYTVTLSPRGRVQVRPIRERAKRAQIAARVPQIADTSAGANQSRSAVL